MHGSNSKLQQQRCFCFLMTAACFVQGSPESWLNMLAFYVIPVAPGKSAILFSGFFTELGMKSVPLIARLVFWLRPRWCVILTQRFDVL